MFDPSLQLRVTGVRRAICPSGVDVKHQRDASPLAGLGDPMRAGVESTSAGHISMVPSLGPTMRLPENSLERCQENHVVEVAFAEYRHPTARALAVRRDATFDGEQGAAP